MRELSGFMLIIALLNVARGLYGALIVEEPVAADVDRDEVLILDDWLLDPKTAQIDPEFEAPTIAVTPAAGAIT
jgi:FtsP/CotA-like multicopper oxidase with cupredoxin domain